MGGGSYTTTPALPAGRPAGDDDQPADRAPVLGGGRPARPRGAAEIERPRVYRGRRGWRRADTALATDPVPAMYFPPAARTWPVMDVAVRTAGKPEAQIAAVRRKIHELDAELPIGTVRTMDEWIATSAGPSRLNAILLGAFAAVALSIAAIG